MTIFLIIMIPVSAFIGFMICALLQIAGESDRRLERLMTEQAQKKHAETQESKGAEA